MLRLEDTLVRLGDAQVRTEAALARLAEAQARTEAALARLVEAQARTEEQLTRFETQVQTFMHWQRGEAGRRDGERYERDVVRRAVALFNGGFGGVPEQPEVQRRLARRLHTALAAGILPSEADPFLADLLWWKGEQLAVVEVSLQIDGDDINRVTQRTNTLRREGIQARAMVIGEDWATLDTQERARALKVDWKVGDDLSSGFLAFRRLALEDSTGAGSLC
jgi:hypothetical protein